MKNVLMAAALAVLAAGAASAQITVSGGLALSSVEVSGTSRYGYTFDNEIGIGGNIYLDYLLPIGLPLSLGIELGYDTATLKDKSGLAEITAGAIPILARVAYHFDLMPRLDLYIVGKIGYVAGTIKSNQSQITDYVEAKGGLGFGGDIGVAFYFTPVIGIFAEAGFDRYALEATGKNGGYLAGLTLDSPFSRFATFGLSLKF